MATLDYRKERKRWRVRWQFTADGVKKSGTKSFACKGLAIDYKNKVEKCLRERKNGTYQHYLIAQAKQKWFKYITRHTQRTQGHYKYVLNQFEKVLSVTEVRDIMSRDIIHYTMLIQSQSTNRTVNAHLTAIKSFCAWLSKFYGIPNPAANVPMLTETPPNVRYLTHEEYTWVIKSAKHPDILAFIANTGIRADELCRIDWSWVSPQRTSLTIEGKGRKKRTIPLNKTCQKILANIDPDVHIKFSRSFTRTSLYNLCVEEAERAGIKKFGPHALRHYFATELLKRGVPISHVSQLLGHASIKTTEKAYIHFLPSYLVGVTEVLEIEPDSINT